MENLLYYGDNLDILRRYVKDETVDLISLDPPFNSNQNYNVLFKEKDGASAASQIQAFGDTWTWGQDDEVVYADLVMAGGKVADVMQAFRTFLRRKQLAGKAFTNWTYEAIRLISEITLINQPRFLQLEYRIIAVNASGASVPSNAAALVL